MFLSRLLLDPRSRAVRRDVADCQALHRTVMSAFPQNLGADPRAAVHVLHRLEEGPAGPLLYVQSGTAPSWTSLEPGYLLDDPFGSDNPAVRPLDSAWSAIAAGDRLRFRLRANPTRKVGTGPESNGKRVALTGDAERLGWIVRKGQEGGFHLAGTEMDPEVPDVRVVPVGGQPGRREGGVVRFAAVVFEGWLVVDDTARFRVTLRDGIGSAKAYGFGLLSVAR